MFLSPSAIHYIDGGEGGGGGGLLAQQCLQDTRDRDLMAVSRKIAENGDYPKIQVVEKDGHWFSLNAAQLALCRRLERAGHCARVRADVVPLSEVPEDVRRMMVPPPRPFPSSNPTSPVTSPTAATVPGPGRPEQQVKEDDQSRSTGKGYQKLDTREAEKTGEATSDSDDNASSSEDSDFEETDSECDWSQEEGESSECGSSVEDEDKSTDDERECLL